MPTYNGTEQTDYINGGDGNDYISGYGSDDVLYGYNGSDSINGGAANDHISDYDWSDSDGYSDTLNGYDGNDTLRGGYSDNIDGGLGIDILDMMLSHAPGGVYFDFTQLWAGATYVLGGATIQNMEKLGLCYGSPFDDYLVTGSPSGGYSVLAGENGNDVLIGGEGWEEIFAGTRYAALGLDLDYDQLYGEGGPDELHGATGDYLDGGDGIDTAYLDLTTSSSAITFNVTTILTTGSATISGTTLVNFEYLAYLGAGIYNDSIDTSAEDRDTFLYGNAGNDVLTTGDGEDTLNGGSGADTMTGGLGDDDYYVDTTSDSIIELAGEGDDTVIATVTYTIGSAIEKLGLSGVAAINGTGNGGPNLLVGNEAANVLNGNGGNDTLTGWMGNDTLSGGGGADSMTGNLGDDRYIVDIAGDTVTEASGEGIDTVASAIAYTLGSNVENLELTGTSAINGTGNALANLLTGNTGANTLTGQDGDDGLYGGADADILLGGNGNDTLDGGTGNDGMTGSIGNDRYVVDAAGDSVTEYAGEGADTVESSIGYILGAFVENLVLTGASAIDGTGNTLDNSLTGNGAANHLFGGDGNDTLDGGASTDIMEGQGGDDRYLVDATGDVVTEYSNAGTDTVASTIAYSLGSALENLELAGTGAINGNGNGGENRVTGNAAVNVLNGNGGNDTLLGAGGNDTIVGGGGNDKLLGGLGADTLTGGANADQYWFNTALGSGNLDTISDFSTVEDLIKLDLSIFTGLTAGTLAAAAFRMGTAAADADDRILYDSTTGSIYYDADGTGAVAAVQFAQVVAGTGVTAAHFSADTFV